MSLETINATLLDLKPEDLLLDLGSGEGRHTISFGLSQKITAIGLDLSHADLKTATERLSDFQDLSCEQDQQFNKVVCSEVLEHIHDYQAFLREIKRVIRPGGVFAVSVPAALPEWVCWKLSDAYHGMEGGHIRIFSARTLHRDIEQLGFKRYRSHKAHALHVPYWWLKCLLWRTDPQHPLVTTYHRFLVWDLMKKPWISRTLERLLNPILGKSIVMYYVATESDYPNPEISE